MTRTIVVCLLLGLSPIAVRPQPPNPRPAFDVATVKADPCGGQKSNRAAGDQFISTDQSLKQLIVLAFEVQPYQVSGPSWLESTCFDITGKYPPGTSYHDRWLMMRTLLEDRFHMAVHHESRQMPGYALVVAKGGFKLKPSEPGDGSTSGGNQGRVWTFRAHKIPMSDLAYELADSMGTVVVDQTGLDGVYDFQLRWSSDDMNSPAGGEANTAPSVFTALQDTLGLALERRKVPVDTVVVDRIDRTPAEN